MKVFIIVAVSFASVAAGASLGAQKASTATDSKKPVDKRSLWQLGSFFSGFGDSLARSDDGHGAGSFTAEPKHFGGGGGGGAGVGAGWHQEFHPAVHQQPQQHQVHQLHDFHHHQWAQVQSGPEHEPQAHPVHEWHAEPQGAGVQHHFLADHVPQHQPFSGGSFEHQPKQEQPSFDWHHQQLLHQAAGAGPSSSHEWQHDDAKDTDSASHGGHGEWAPITSAGAGSSDLLHKEHSVKAVSSETSEHQHQEWAAPAEGKEEHHEGHHHHTKIIKVPYPVHIEKPYPVYIEKPFIVEKPVPLKLYIKKKHH